MTAKITLTSALLGFVSTLMAHAWAILRLKHHGQGLAMRDLFLVALGLLAALLVWATAALTDGSVPGYPPVVIVAVSAASFAVAYSFMGRAAAAGYVITVLATEPVGLVLRALELHALDKLLTTWVFVALFMLFLRSSRLQAKTE